jgi:hypothetical protein
VARARRPVRRALLRGVLSTPIRCERPQTSTGVVSRP